MIKKILLIAIGLVAVVVVGFCAIVSLQPDQYSVERSTVIEAPPDVVFAQVNDLQAWEAWTPWKDLDPNAKTTISDPSAGKGATFTWTGNDQIGEGSMTIIESKPDTLVDIEQAFVRPFEGKANLTFTLTPVESGTQLSWRLHGKNNFVGKAVCLFADMDAMAGGRFEQGLARIKAIAESPAK